MEHQRVRSEADMTEREFLPDNAIPLDQIARDERKLARLARNPARVLVKGGKRVIAVKVKIPIEQYAGLQRFEGATDSDKVLTLLRIANRRVDQAEYDLIKERAKAALEPGEKVSDTGNELVAT